MTQGQPPGTNHQAERERGIVLAIVLVLIFSLTAAVVAFQRRALIDTTVAQNRLAAAEADALARGGLRLAEAVVHLSRLKAKASELDAAGATLPGQPPGQPPGAPANPASGLGGSLLPSADLWQQLGGYPLEFSRGRSLRVRVEDEGAFLNLNALVPPPPPAEEGDPNALGEQPLEDDGESLEESEQYLTKVLEYIVEGMDGTREEKAYDEGAIARHLIDWMDPDSTAREGGDEDAYYQRQEPPYRARNGPFLSFDEIGLVEGIDGKLLEAMRSSLTIHPIGAESGINLNRAEPWVLALVYAGVDGDRRLLPEDAVREIAALRAKGKQICGETGGDAKRCVPLNEVANGALGEGSVFPPIEVPARAVVFRVTAEARVDGLIRRMEAVIDTRSTEGPLLLSWRRLRGSD